MDLVKITNINNDDTTIDLLFRFSTGIIKPFEKERVKKLELESWLIKVPDVLNPIGIIWLSFERIGNKEEQSISIIIRPSYQKLGNGLKAIVKFTDYFFSVTTHQKLIALILRTNSPSINVFKKAGYKLRDVDDSTAGWEFYVYEIHKNMANA